MNKLSLFLKSIVIGFASLAVPGLSASTIAIVLCVYYDMIYAISHILKKPRQSLSFLGVLLAGYGVGALAGAVAVNTLYINFPVPVIAAVLGFLIGSIPRTVVDNKENFKHPPDILVMLIVGSIFVIYSLVITNGTPVSFDSIRFPTDYIIMFVVGLITSTTLVVPGVDFAVTLMAMGYYYAFIGLAGNLVTGLFSFGFSGYYFQQLFLMLIYLVGYGVGSFLFSKGLRYLIARFPRQLQSVNVALILVAPVIVIEKCVLTNPDVNLMQTSWKQWVWAFIMFAAGYFAYTWVPMLCRYLHLLPQNTAKVIATEANAARHDIPMEDALAKKTEIPDKTGAEEAPTDSKLSSEKKANNAPMGEPITATKTPPAADVANNSECESAPEAKSHIEDPFDQK